MSITGTNAAYPVPQVTRAPNEAPTSNDRTAAANDAYASTAVPLPPAQAASAPGTAQKVDILV
jgi:hypothetical protein